MKYPYSERDLEFLQRLRPGQVRHIAGPGVTRDPGHAYLAWAEVVSGGPTDPADPSTYQVVFLIKRNNQRVVVAVRDMFRSVWSIHPD